MQLSHEKRHRLRRTHTDAQMRRFDIAQEPALVEALASFQKDFKDFGHGTPLRHQTSG
jgi:hypothetical protein